MLNLASTRRLAGKIGMCGIFGYVGKKEALPILINGLSLLDDSAGIYTPHLGSIKSVGAVENLKPKLAKIKNGSIQHFGRELSAERLTTSGIAHLRWATHGEPTVLNAHPHCDCSKEIWVVHNGIIENFQELKTKLTKLGHKFVTQTDTEVLAHLAEHYLKKEKDFESAVIKTLNDVRGTYGLIFSYKKEPSKIITARMGAPIVIGLGEHENFIASDPSPILRHTKNVIYLQDGEIAVIRPLTIFIA
jgi:glutamine---fructose-6-phosphate transaminase (isomerizing)